jgi:multicomponent Na+:H+ antiporter subunit G
VGVFFVLVAAIGLLRFPDIYTRLHAASKGVTFGFIFVVLGAAILLEKTGTDLAKVLLAILFQFIAAPVVGHMIARVAIRKGIRPIKNPAGELHEPK